MKRLCNPFLLLGLLLIAIGPSCKKEEEAPRQWHLQSLPVFNFSRTKPGKSPGIWKTCRGGGVFQAPWRR